MKARLGAAEGATTGTQVCSITVTGSVTEDALAVQMLTSEVA